MPPPVCEAVCDNWRDVVHHRVEAGVRGGEVLDPEAVGHAVVDGHARGVLVAEERGLLGTLPFVEWV